MGLDALRVEVLDSAVGHGHCQWDAQGLLEVLGLFCPVLYDEGGREGFLLYTSPIIDRLLFVLVVVVC